MARTLTVAKDSLYGGDAVPKGTKVEFLGVFHNGRKGMVKIRVSDDLPRVHNADNVFLVAPEFFVEPIGVIETVVYVKVRVVVHHECDQCPSDVISNCNYEFAIEPDDGKKTPLIANTELVDYSYNYEFSDPDEKEDNDG